jgi:hypothetical protein
LEKVTIITHAWANLLKHGADVGYRSFTAEGVVDPLRHHMILQMANASRSRSSVSTCNTDLAQFDSKHPSGLKQLFAMMLKKQSTSQINRLTHSHSVFKTLLVSSNLSYGGCSAGRCKSSKIEKTERRRVRNKRRRRRRMPKELHLRTHMSAPSKGKRLGGHPVSRTNMICTKR